MPRDDMSDSEIRDIRLVKSRDWLVLIITGTRRGKERVKHVHLRRDEAALVVSLLSNELGQVTTTKTR